MARGRKAKVQAALLTDANELKQIDVDLRNAEQRRDDAAMSVAGQYKAAAARGVHREALKFARKGSKMSQEKFADLWRAIKVYVPILCADHLAQPDLLEHAADSEHDDERDDPLPFNDDADGFGDESTAADLDFSDADASEQEQPLPVNDADWQEPLVIAGDDELVNAGAAFNGGRAAGRNGDEPSLNPHEIDTAAHALWAKGYTQGLDEGPELPDPSEEPAQAAPRRRGRPARNTVATPAFH